MAMSVDFTNALAGSIGDLGGLEGIELGSGQFLCNGPNTLPAYQALCNIASSLGNVTLPEAPQDEGEGAEEEEEEDEKDNGKNQDREPQDVGPASRRKLIRGVKK